MPWCPECKSEFREGFRICNSCNVELVNELMEKEGKEVNNNSEGSSGYEGEALLITVADDNHAAIIEAKLKYYDIPVLKKYKESGGYMNIYMGNTSFGVELYVPVVVLKEARELIKEEVVLLEELEENIEVELDEEDAEFLAIFEKRKRTRGLIILLFLMPGVLWILVSIILNLIK